jgi:hypothetical protein
MCYRIIQIVGLLDKARMTVCLYDSVTYMGYMGVMVFMDYTLKNVNADLSVSRTTSCAG